MARYSRRNRVKVARGEAHYGIAVANQMHFFGYRLHLLVTLQGVITNFVLPPARPHDVRVAPKVLEDEANLLVTGDAGYVSEPLAVELTKQDIILLTPAREGQSRRPHREMRRMLRSVRQLIETVGSQLERIFNVSVVLAKSVWGINTRIIDKLTFHTPTCYLNRMLGRPTLHIAGLICG